MIRSRRADIVALLLVCTAVLAGFFEVPFLGRTFSTSYLTANANGVDPPIPPAGRKVDAPPDPVRIDQGASAWQFEPWGEIVAREFRSGHWPLWNPYSATGKPLAANMQSAAFDPLLLPVHLHATPLFWDLCFLLALLLGAVGGYAFLRILGLGPVAGATGTLTFTLSGYFFLYSNNQFFRSYLYLPALLLGVDRVIARRRPLAVLGLASALAGNFLVGMPESTLFVVGATVLYALFRIVGAPERRRSLAGLMAAGALALAFVLPLLLLFVEYVSISHNTHSNAAKVGLQADPTSWLLGWLVPFARGRGSFVGLREWVGASASVAAVAAIASPTWRRRGGLFFAVLGVAVIAKIFGAPVIAEVGRLPLVVRASFPAFAPPVGAFCIAVLAGAGVQAVADGDVDRRVLAAGAVVLVALTAWLTKLARPDLVHGSDRIVPFAGAIVAFTLAVAIVALLKGPRASVLLAGVIVVELLALAPRGMYPERADPYTPPPAVELIRSKGLATWDRTFGLDARLFPDIPGALGISDVRTLDALFPKRFFDYINTFVQPSAYTRYVGGPHGGNPGEEVQLSEVAANPMWDMLGVRYLLSGGTAPERSGLVERIFASRPPDAGLRPTVFDLGGDARPVLFEHSGQQVEFPVESAQATGFTFSYAMQTEAFGDLTDDGVEFVISGRTDDNVVSELFRATMVPRQDPVGPEWRSGQVALRGTHGPVRSLILEVRPRANAHTDWAGWADLHFTGADGPTPAPVPQYELLGSAGNATVYRNTTVAPRALVVHDVVGVRNEEAAINRFKSSGGRFPGGAVRVGTLDPRKTAVVEGRAGGRMDCRGDAATRIRAYEPQEVRIDVDSPCPGLLVLTDTYYPGWKAEVNGAGAAVYPTDVLFRGVDVPAGRSTVVFRYRPTNFRLGLLGPPAGLTVWASWAVVTRRRRSGAVVGTGASAGHAPDPNQT